MRKIKFTPIKRFAGILCLLGIAVIFSTCGNYSIWYTFDNQSSRTIYVTLSEEYSYKINDEYVKSDTKELTVDNNSSKKILVNSNSVDFSWTAYNENDNQYIYCAVNQNQATFKNR